MLPGGGYALPGLQAHTPQARASVAPPGEISGTVLLILPGSGCALPGLQDPLTGSHPAGPASARRRAMASGTVPLILPGGGCALPGLQAPLTGSHSVGPRKRSAAGRDIRHGTLDFAGWRLRLTRPTGSSHRLTLRRPAQAQRRRAMALGTIAVILPGGGWRLTRPTGSFHWLTPRRPAQAQRRRARFQARYP